MIRLCELRALSGLDKKAAAAAENGVCEQSIFMYGLSPFPLILYNLGARGGRARSCRPGPLNQTIDLRYGARVGVELAVRPNVTTKPVFTKCQPRGWRKG